MKYWRKLSPHRKAGLFSAAPLIPLAVVDAA
jgi:hypothetical protein